MANKKLYVDMGAFSYAFSASATAYPSAAQSALGVTETKPANKPALTTPRRDAPPRVILSYVTTAGKPVSYRRYCDPDALGALLSGGTTPGAINGNTFVKAHAAR